MQFYAKVIININAGTLDNSVLSLYAKCSWNNAERRWYDEIYGKYENTNQKKKKIIINQQNMT